MKTHVNKHGLFFKVSWKLHILLEHLGPFLEQKGVGLGRFAEQAIESVHAKFKPTWQRYKVSQVHEGQGDCLKKARVNFSARRQYLKKVF